MKRKYEHLLSPLKIGNTVLKSRLCFPVAQVHCLNGPEKWPSEGYMTFYTNMARNGCAYINFGEWNDTRRDAPMEDARRMQYFDTSDPALDNYLCQIADDCHAFGTLLSLNTFEPALPEGYSYAGGMAPPAPPTMKPVMTKPATTQMLYDAIEAFAQNVYKYKTFGYGMATVPFGLGPGIAGAPLRPDQRRTDEFADYMDYQRALYTRVKQLCGKNFLLEVIVYGDGMVTPEMWGEYSKQFEGLIDIWTLRERDIAKCHPTSFTFRKGEHEVIEYARRMRATGTKAVIGVNGGFQDPDECEAYIANGDCDLISMGRAWFADPEYGKKLLEGRGEDVTPCLWCNKCHGTQSAPWLSVCSVNPIMGNAHKLHRMFDAQTTPKKVAVIGGGTAGMTSAIYAARRGHDVTLYEKTDYLGGQLQHADVADFKWSIRDFRLWQVRQLEKLGVRVVMQCDPTPEMIEEEGYEALIACTGASPNVPAFARDETGHLKEGLTTCIDVFKQGEASYGKHVIIAGGSETGIETALYLGEAGHEVTVLTRQDTVAHDASKLHYITMSWIDENDPAAKAHVPFGGIRPEWEKEKYHIHPIVRATTREVTPQSVTYVDEEGAEHTLSADSVVICGGMNPRVDEALKYAGSVRQFMMAGDCEGIGNIQKCTRSGFSKAMMI